MATKTIAWATGTGSITISYGGSGSGTATITTSDNNLYEARSQEITLRTTAGSPQVTKKVTITQAARVRTDISAAVVTAANQTYNGSALTPTPTVTLGGVTVPSTGYDVTYSNNTNAGSATITVTGKGDYTGTATGTFTIAKATRTISFTMKPAGNTIDLGNSVAVAATPSAGVDDGTITYTSSNTSRASIDGDMIVTHLSGGATITASISGGTNYEDAQTSFSLTVADVTFAREYLTITSCYDDNAISWKSSTSTTFTISWSKDKQTWNSATSSTGGTALATINCGERLYIKGNNSTYGANGYYNTLKGSKKYNVSGNIMSLVYEDNFATQKSLSDTYTFNSLFRGETRLVSISSLKLPATTLANYCYQGMFYDCTGLTNLPSGLLPATTTKMYCYQSMFYECTGLTSIPTGFLPAKTLSNSCYRAMFYGCGLSSVPSNLLPATTLKNSCYYQMFRGNNITTAPNLPAKTLVTSCYTQMFYNCKNLNYIKAMFTNTPGTSYTSNWVSGVAATGTFVKNSAATWSVSGNSGIPSGWTVETASS